ncbi:IS21-like element helper ATPase IstB [Telluribacter humicola]|uniref:IS21-like element helper ATPase IstB n=1 Tax=Telluribacter humicola TaxID=1720261 RepID=UPI001A96B340|nr:IS21-like element helper ATPase IstB [Telluribacter humicola]
MDTIKTLEQLQQLRLQGMANRYKDILDLPLQQQPEAHQMLAWLAEAEGLYRNHQRTQLYLRLSKLRYHATLEQVHCSASRGLTQEQLLLLGDGMFIQKAENVILTGATGCGKSYLACALGRRACMLGYRTLYFSMNRFIEALAAARIDGSYIKWLNQIAKTPLLILDDFGLQPLFHDMKLTLLQILEDRYATGATIITSQLPFSNWYDYLDDPTLADAIMDRMSASAHKIQLAGQSLRNKKIQ